MKNYLTNIVYYFSVVTLLMFVSCEGNDLVLETIEETDITEAIEKIETVYTEGCLKIEKFDPDYVKIETEAPDDLKQRILETLEKTFSKTHVLKNNGNLVGVFKSGGCGGYSVLEVIMDSEDSNPASSITGWSGDSYLTGSGAKNVALLFCVVDGAYFERTTVDYAILNLSSSSSWGDAEGLQRYFDNEDSSNQNIFRLDGQNISGWVGDCYFGSNTRLQFYYYTATGSGTAIFPYLGFSYGTLGTYGSYQGNIYSDDEDSSNANAAYYWSGAYANPVSTGHVPNIMNVNSNTRLFLSKAY